MTTLYEKKGRKYVPVSVSWHDREQDSMGVGEFRLTYVYAEGGRRYEYKVTPATAAWVAAAMIARVAMEDAIRKQSVSVTDTFEYTSKQKAIIEKFKSDMAAAGALMPRWWQEASPHEISKAAIEAVERYAP